MTLVDQNISKQNISKHVVSNRRQLNVSSSSLTGQEGDDPFHLFAINVWYSLAILHVEAAYNYLS